MRKVDANPDNLPLGEFEEFNLADAVVVAEPRRVYGKLKDICAHRRPQNLKVVYTEISDLEILSDDNKSGLRFAVSFRARFELYDRDAKRLAPPAGADADYTRIRYWNFNEKEFHALKFLRAAPDKLLFIAACEDANKLIVIACEHMGKDAALARLAYDRALQLLGDGIADEATLALLRNYIAGLLKRGVEPDLSQALAAYRRLDQYGSGGPGLAAVLHHHHRSAGFIAEILQEALARLGIAKQKHYSVHMADILDFVCAEKFATPAREQLLWQTYLAASAERELPVLKRVWSHAVKMKADRETLQLIYNTWKGFAQPPRKLPRGKAPPQVPAR